MYYIVTTSNLQAAATSTRYQSITALDTPSSLASTAPSPLASTIPDPSANSTPSQDTGTGRLSPGEKAGIAGAVFGAVMVVLGILRYFKPKIRSAIEVHEMHPS